MTAGLRPDAGPAALYEKGAVMRRIARSPLTGLVLLALAVAVAVLVLGQGGAGPAAAQPAQPHYKCYDIPPGPAPVPTVTLQTQFGTEEIPVGMPAKLCLPAGKNAEPTPGPEWPHLKCYNILGQNPPNLVNLETQFGAENYVAVRQASLLCVPAAKTIPPALPGSEPPPTLHYECYDIRGSDPPDVVALRTQFGIESGVAVGQATKLCVPALKNGEGNLGAPDLKCYTIAGAPPGPVVNLTTQFDVEAGIPVGEPSLLCVPATKQEVVPPTAVGGIAELPDVAGASADEAGASAGGSGWSAGSYAALAGGLAAAVVLLSASWWYARRRFSRS